jgi:hypothetical protein
MIQAMQANLREHPQDNGAQALCEATLAHYIDLRPSIVRAAVEFV